VAGIYIANEKFGKREGKIGFVLERGHRIVILERSSAV